MFLDGTNVHPYGSFWLDFADKLIKGLAVIVAGAWGLMNFMRSGVFHRRLEPSVSGEIFSKDGESYIHVSMRLKNVGQSRYTITQEGTSLVATTLSIESRDEISITPVFVRHAWIEPGEQIEEPVILTIPQLSTFVAVELTLRVVSRTPEPIEWNCTCIVRETRDKTSS